MENVDKTFFAKFLVGNTPLLPNAQRNEIPSDAYNKIGCGAEKRILKTTQSIYAFLETSPTGRL